MDKTLKCDLTNKELVLDVGVSAYSSNPQNLFMKGPPSTGKTAVTVAVTSYFPEEDVWSLGNMTPKALIHGKSTYNEQDGKYYIDLENKLFNSTNDNFTVRVAHNVGEACQLIEAGFEYVTGEYSDGGKVFRKRN